MTPRCSQEGRGVVRLDRRSNGGGGWGWGLGSWCLTGTEFPLYTVKRLRSWLGRWRWGEVSGLSATGPDT